MNDSGQIQRRDVRFITPSGLYRMSYVEWGRSDNPRVLVCVHGLTRCARDFDYLARALAQNYRIICPDVPGRGESAWLKNPMEYVVPTYVAAMVTLIARIGAERVDWLGTSMGGIIGMALAALPDSPIGKLVLNDAGPLVTAASLDRIGEYVGRTPVLPSLKAAEVVVRAVSAPFGPHTDEEWRFLTEHITKPVGNGEVSFRYDPAIAVAFNAEKPHKDIDLWPYYDAIRSPTLVLRGAESDLLTRDTARAMIERGPKATLVEFAGVGHAPTLIHDDQIAAVKRFLLD